MELKDIYELWDRLETSSVQKLELEMQGVRLVLKKGEPKGASGAPVFLSEPAKEPKREAATELSLEEDAAKESRIVIKAPLVGTFYQAPAPGEPPFVTVGQQVHKGDVVGIIEAMKLVNEITANEDGTVTAITAEDGSMVEYDQVLIELMK